MEYFLTRQSKIGTREENKVQIVVQLSLSVVYGRGGVNTRRVKVTDPENRRTVVQGLR